MKGSRDLLLATKPKLKKIEIDGADYFIRELTVGEVNEQIYGQQHRLMRIAKEQGIELNLENEEELTKQLTQIYDPYALSRTLAMRLCDEHGKNLFDPNNNADLEALSRLDNDIFKKLTDAIKGEEAKKKLTARRKFQLTLSLALGKTLSEIEAMPECHLQEYEQFYQEQPFGLWREDYRTAQIAYLLAAINSDPKKDSPKLTEFMPFFANQSAVENNQDFDDGSEMFLAQR